jgi:hypothetical protein
MKKPQLYKASFQFTQPGNTNGTTDETEILTIDCESVYGYDEEPGRCFFVIKSETGWSIDSMTELQELFDRIQKSIKKPGGDK